MWMQPKHAAPDVRSGEITEMLQLWRGGDEDAFSQLITRMYPDLRRLAALHMRRERTDHTLQPTALVNELFLHLAMNTDFEWKDRSHFLAVASQAMRRFLVDYARARKSQKRGGGVLKVEILDLSTGGPQEYLDTLVLNELLERLEREEPRMAKVVELHCFGGLTFSEIAEVIGTDERTGKRDWQVARAWLMGQLRKGCGDGGRVGKD
jgi:RNA polymerase sigma factor (TIGR02999 family)